MKVWEGLACGLVWSGTRFIFQGSLFACVCRYVTQWSVPVLFSWFQGVGRTRKEGCTYCRTFWRARILPRIRSARAWSLAYQEGLEIKAQEVCVSLQLALCKNSISCVVLRTWHAGCAGNAFQSVVSAAEDCLGSLWLRRAIEVCLSVCLFVCFVLIILQMWVFASMHVWVSLACLVYTGARWRCWIPWNFWVAM